MGKYFAVLRFGLTEMFDTGGMPRTLFRIAYIANVDMEKSNYQPSHFNCSLLERRPCFLIEGMLAKPYLYITATRSRE